MIALLHRIRRAFRRWCMRHMSARELREERAELLRRKLRLDSKRLQTGSARDYAALMRAQDLVDDVNVEFFRREESSDVR